MDITPRLLSLAAAFVFVCASPYAMHAQSTQSKAPLLLASATAAPVTSAPKPAESAAAPTPTPARAGVAVGPELEPQGFTYSPDGRRDPFISLLQHGSNTLKPTLGARAAGLLGLETSEITLKGTIVSEGGFVGILQGSDNKTYIVRAGERLLDGTIRTITQDSVVITQRVTDPLSLEKQREVRKVLRQTQEAK